MIHFRDNKTGGTTKFLIFMCFIKDDQADSLAVASLASHNHVPSVADRQLALESIVDGRYLRTDYGTSVPCALACAMSTMSALAKELTLDVAGLGIHSGDPEAVRAVAREFGMYTLIPALQIQHILRRLLFVSWKRGSSFSSLVTKFLKLFKTGDHEKALLVILATHLNFGMYAASLYGADKHSMPFSVDINRRGKVYLVYRYRNQGNRQRIIRWDLELSIPKANPMLAEMMLQDLRSRQAEAAAK